MLGQIVTDDKFKELQSKTTIASEVAIKYRTGQEFKTENSTKNTQAEYILETGTLKISIDNNQGIHYIWLTQRDSGVSGKKLNFLAELIKFEQLLGQEELTIKSLAQAIYALLNAHQNQYSNIEQATQARTRPQTQRFTMRSRAKTNYDNCINTMLRTLQDYLFKNYALVFKFYLCCIENYFKQNPITQIKQDEDFVATILGKLDSHIRFPLFKQAHSLLYRIALDGTCLESTRFMFLVTAYQQINDEQTRHLAFEKIRSAFITNGYSTPMRVLGKESVVPGCIINLKAEISNRLKLTERGTPNSFNNAYQEIHHAFCADSLTEAQRQQIKEAETMAVNPLFLAQKVRSEPNETQSVETNQTTTRRRCRG